MRTHQNRRHGQAGRESDTTETWCRCQTVVRDRYGIGCKGGVAGVGTDRELIRDDLKRPTRGECGRVGRRR